MTASALSASASTAAPSAVDEGSGSSALDEASAEAAASISTSIRVNFLGEVLVDIAAVKKPRVRKVSFNKEALLKPPRRGSLRVDRQEFSMRSRLLPHLREDSAAGPSTEQQRWGEMLRAGVTTTVMAGVALSAAAIVAADAGGLASDTATVLVAGSCTCAGMVALISGGASLMLPQATAFAGRQALNAVARQRAERQRQLILAPGMLLLLCGAAVIVRTAPDPLATTLSDVSTDLLEPPGFVSFNASFSAASVPAIRRRYPSLSPLHVPHPPSKALHHALAAARALGWEVAPQRPRRGVGFEARAGSQLLPRDVSDIVVRIRPDGPPLSSAKPNATSEASASVVDVRSRSRDRIYDLGLNVHHIRLFASRLVP